MTWAPSDQELVAPTEARKRVCYISGPMRGYERYNFPAFHAAQKYLEKRGWYVYSPASMDRDIDGFDGEGEWSSTIEESLRRDFSVICRSGSIFLLKGWEKSSGANEELKVASVLKLNVFEFEYDTDGEISGWHRLEDGITRIAKEDVMEWLQETVKSAPPLEIGQQGELEYRVVDPNTGGEKGSKLPRFDLIPPDAMEQLAIVYGVGSKKYADRNWQRGYKWGLSYASLQRHANQFWGGEDKDPDGFYHLAAVAWHALALLHFRLNNLGTDDRAPDFD